MPGVAQKPSPAKSRPRVPGAHTAGSPLSFLNKELSEEVLQNKNCKIHGVTASLEKQMGEVSDKYRRGEAELGANYTGPC